MSCLNFSWLQRRRMTARLSVALVLSATVTLAAAGHLGVIGPTYGIAEPHLLKYIEQKLRDKERTGELQRLMEAAQRRGVDAVRNPVPVAGLRAASQARTYYVDPSFTLDRNVSDAKGNFLFPAGTRKNPLEVISMSRMLVFFDGRDPRQVQHASHLMAREPGRVKPILTAGSYLTLMKRWSRPVFFDQQGTLTRRLGIQQLPAVVTQEGLRLRIDEVVLP